MIRISSDECAVPAMPDKAYVAGMMSEDHPPKDLSRGPRFPPDGQAHMSSAAQSGDPLQWSAWMAQAQDGDREAYRRLLHAIQPYVRAIAARMFRDQADVEDAVQDILITVHEAHRTYDPSRPFKPWLAGILRYRLADRLRAKGRIFSRETSLTTEHETFSAAEANDEAMILDTHALRAAISRLPDAERLAVERLKLREMSLRDVSAETGLSVGALKVATHRGLKRLRRLLTG